MIHNSITPDLVQQKIDELIALKQQLESGKATIANAITSKGVTTSQDAEFNLLAENILAIEQGVDPNSITVSAEITQGSWSSNKMTVTAKAKGSNGKTATASTTVDATSIYNAGKSAGSSSGGGSYSGKHGTWGAGDNTTGTKSLSCSYSLNALILYALNSNGNPVAVTIWKGGSTYHYYYRNGENNPLIGTNTVGASGDSAVIRLMSIGSTVTFTWKEKTTYTLYYMYV